MKTWGAIFNIIAVVLLLMSLVVYRNQTIAEEKLYNELVLKKAVDYSAEAAFIAALSSDNIDIDYDDMESVVLSPGDSLDIFESMMCLNYNISASEDN